MTDVKFGIAISNIPHDGSRGHEFTSRIEDYLTRLEHRYESVWIPDHLTPAGAQATETIDVLESQMSISYLSARFQKLKFGTIVTCNSFRNSALLAKMGATLDALTGGRFILGIGAGYYQDDYSRYGYEYPTPAVRIRQLEEGLQIIKRLWTEDNVTFKGTYFQVENAYCYPKPDPISPIMVASIGEQLSMKLVAKYADWWNIPFTTVERYRHKLGVLKRHCKKIGRDPNTLVKTQLQFVSIAETDEKAKTLFHNSLYGKRFRGISGSPETITRKLKEHIEVGVDYFMLWFIPFPNLKNSMIFAKEIMPELGSHF